MSFVRTGSVFGKVSSGKVSSGTVSSGTAALAGVLAGLLVATLAVPAPARAAASYTSQTLHFRVTVGPDRSQVCDIVGLLFTPTTASAANPVPAILTTNGFGGSDSDQVPFAEQEAAQGYVVLSYSGLGFGGSGCKITLDDPDYDGIAASQLVSYLGGAPGIAFTDAQHTAPAPVLDVVTHDATDHAGQAQPYDPRVGMWGGSYGGQIQFAAASVDPRIDALNPQITWNDLSYSLDPNNTDQTAGVSTGTPGTTKSTWAAAFSAEGIFDGVEYASNDPSRLIGCPNFADFVCPALVTGGSTGYLQPADTARLRHASVSSYLSKIRVPVLLDQGEVDTLFNLNEAIATFTALQAQGTPVAMLWREQGHSGGTPSAAGSAYEQSRIQNWFDHYLKDSAVSTGSAFAYYRDWTGDFAEASGFPAATGSQTYYLSGGSSLTTDPAQITADSQSMLTPPAGAPTTLDGLDVLGAVSPVPLDQPDVNVPGSYTDWASAALAAPVTVVGSPRFTVRVSAPTVLPTTDPAGQLVLFAKLYDVAPDGTAGLINGLVAPVRIPDPSQPVQITLPGIAHQFPAGHRIEIMLAGGDVNYRGGLVATPVTVTTGST
ncbi:MAG TPA: CocE/NonD family hydrolase, partial [Jatrophihabitans sp.]|nr:CocE/NonD family hydrolase [Jatrophihabitans sp.]